MFFQLGVGRLVILIFIFLFFVVHVNNNNGVSQYIAPLIDSSAPIGPINR